MEGTVVESCFVIDLPFLGGSTGIEKSGYKTFSLCKYDNEHE